MSKNPDTYLLYEYMKKIPFTLRIKVQLDELIDKELLTKTAQEAFLRFPYFSVQIGLDEGANYVLLPNNKPIAVIPEEDRRIELGSPEVNNHLFAISYKYDTIWFNCSHSICGAFGIMFWIKTTLYQYLCSKYGKMEAPSDIKLPGTPVTEKETFYPDSSSLPTDEPIVRYNGGDTNLAIGRTLKFLLNPFVKNNYYYEIELPAIAFMDYAKSIDASPNTLIVAMMYKAMTNFLKEKEGSFISGRIAADYRDDIGANGSYHDFVRFIHCKYEWNMKDESIKKLNMRARGALISQNQPELSYERFRKIETAHIGIDEQPTLKLKKKFASKNSTYRNDPRDIYTVSYVGQIDFGEMEKHIKSIFTITDGDLMLEVNSLKENFDICFQLIDKDRKPLEAFLNVLDKENIPYSVSPMKTRYMPAIKFPK